MRLNTLMPKAGSRHAKKRLGRGIGCTDGKTCGRGHKGQRARAGGYHKVGFEGGQMPMQRRLPKFGFTSRTAQFTTVLRLNDLMKVKGDVVSLLTLMEANLIPGRTQKVRVIAAGKVARSLTLQGINVTKGAKEAITQAGGKVE